MKKSIFWKILPNFAWHQTLNRDIKITKCRAGTCDTALESWGSIFFDEKVFYHTQQFFTPLFFVRVKNISFSKNQNFRFLTWKRGVKTFWRWVKNFFSKNMCHQLSNAVSHVPVRFLVKIMYKFENHHKIVILSYT